MSNPMTLRELLAGATPGPWRACAWDPMERPHVHKDKAHETSCRPPDLPLTEEDAELIAYLRNNAERLAACEALSEEILALGNECICPPGLQELPGPPPHTGACKALAAVRSSKGAL